MLHAFRDSPRRAPNWRWLRTEQIDAGGQRAARSIDGEDGFTWIRRALRLKRRFALIGNRPHQIYQLVQYDRPLFWAHSMWAEDKQPTRWAIEARILAGETDEEIANRLGTDADVIAAYEAVFFNVRDRLEKRDYITNVVMSDAVTRGLSERQYDLLWKLFGYAGGPHVLDAMMSKCSAISRPQRAEDVSGFFQEFAVAAMRHKAAVATLTVPINTHTQLALIDSYVKYVEIERTTDNEGQAHSTIVNNIGAMLGALPFQVGTKLESASSKMLPFDDGAAELTSQELMIVASGGKLNDQRDIQELRFPGE